MVNTESTRVPALDGTDAPSPLWPQPVALQLTPVVP